MNAIYLTVTMLLLPFYLQGNYWSSNVNEVQGFVMDQEGKVVRRLFGKWHEGLYCGVPPSAKCIWRTGNHVNHTVAKQDALNCFFDWISPCIEQITALE